MLDALKVPMLFLVMVCLCVCGVSPAETIVPTGPSDARGCRDWGGGFGAYWVDGQDSSTLTAYYDPSDSSYRWWYVPVLEFPVDSLSGRTDIQASLRIYFEGVSGGVQIRYGSDNNGVIENSDWLNFGTTVTSFPEGTTGWVELDVSAQLQSLVDEGSDWAVFTVRPSDWWCGATVRASEYSGSAPQLSITPEPATLSLLALGGLALVRRRRRYPEIPRKPFSQHCA